MAKPEEIVIDINPVGKTEAMHFDDFDLEFLGAKHISRASEIFHNEGTQKWDIILPGTIAPVCEAVQGFKGYDVARNFEVSWLQACRKSRVQPTDEDGISIAKNLREIMQYNMCQCGGGDCSQCPR